MAVGKLFALFFLSWSLSSAGPQTEELWEASRRGDLKEVQRLLKAGVNIDGKTRYGVTALGFAADGGHLEVVKLLLESGAEMRTPDSFYSATPLMRALANGRLEVVKLLLKEGSPGGGQVLLAGIRQRQPEMIEAALVSGSLTPNDLSEALKEARRRQDRVLVERLLGLGATDTVQRPQVQLDPVLLQRYLGRYWNESQDRQIEISLEQNQLVAKLQGQPRLKLKAVAEREFEAMAVEDLRLTFSGRAGTVERLLLQQAGVRHLFSPVSDQPNATVGKGVSIDVPIRRGPARPWPGFRGQNASGVADGQGAPLSWSTTDGANVRWKTPIPGISNASPIIWGDRVFVVTSESRHDPTIRVGLYGDVKPVEALPEHTYLVYALHLFSGQVLWKKEVFRGAPRVRRHPKASHSNSTPVTDGRRLVVLLGSIGQLLCLDLEGGILWQTEIGILDSGWFYNPDYQWGHASSPVIYGDLVIVQADIQRGSFIAAYRLKDGSLAWKTEREEIPSWGTPTIYRGPPGDEVITNGTRVRSYDPGSGRLLWTLAPNSEIVVGTPVVADGLIYVTAGYPPVRPIYAIRPGARGDISLADDQSSSRWVAWSRSRGGTYIPSPIAYRGYLYTNANNGRLACYRATDGQLIYRERIGGGGGSYSSSPVAADGRLYFTSEQGIVTVVRSGSSYRELASNEMGEITMTTPAISDGIMVIRTVKHVFGVGDEPEAG